MVNYETSKGSFEANINTYFKNISWQGLKTTHPTQVVFDGRNTAITFDYGKRSDGRFMPGSMRNANNPTIGRTNWHFNHPDASKPRNRMPAMPILTVTTHD